MVCFFFCRLDKCFGLEFGQVCVNFDGVVNIKFLGLLIIQCVMNFVYFFFDYQFCVFLLGLEIYLFKEVVMEIKFVVQLESLKNNFNWNLDNVCKIVEFFYYWQV